MSRYELIINLLKKLLIMHLFNHNATSIKPVSLRKKRKRKRKRKKEKNVSNQCPLLNLHHYCVQTLILFVNFRILITKKFFAIHFMRY